MEKVTLIITVMNEAMSLPALLQSIEVQTQQPHEVVIVDGGSTDHTYALLQAWKPKFPTKMFQKSGNRSVGRNAAIKEASHPIIAITDAGCVLDKQWLKEIVRPFQDKVDVVAGYYRASVHTPFEKAAASYMLVMPENVDAEHFLPATRSMALTKAIWQKAGKFPEQFTNNEDYVFAHALKNSGAKIVFTDKAVVLWQPPSELVSFIKQVYKFAYGDVYAGIIRPKVLFIFARYIVACAIAYISLVLASVLFVAYFLWTIHKNIRHVGDDGVHWLPILQLTTDVTVMLGSVVGAIQKVIHKTHH